MEKIKRVRVLPSYKGNEFEVNKNYKVLSAIENDDDTVTVFLDDEHGNVRSIDHIHLQPLTLLNCEVCGEEYWDEEPKWCCDGRECGCMGQPINGPFVCSEECYEIGKHINWSKRKKPSDYKASLREALNLKEGERKEVLVNPVKDFKSEDIGKKFWIDMSTMDEGEIWRLYELVHIRSGVAFIRDVETDIEKFIVLGTLIFHLKRIEPEKYVTDLDPSIYKVVSRSGKVIITL